MKKVIYSILIIFSFLMQFSTTNAWNCPDSYREPTWYSSVNGNDKILWQGNLKSWYKPYFEDATEKWNELGKYRKENTAYWSWHVKIEESPHWWQTTVNISETNEPYDLYYASWNYGWFINDSLVINTPRFKRLKKTKTKQHVFIHEFGHALALAHSTEDDIMYRKTSDNYHNSTSFGLNDTNCYHYNWDN